MFSAFIILLFVSIFRLKDNLYSCKNGKEGKGFGVIFKLHFLEEQNNYENGKIYLFFSKYIGCTFGNNLNPNPKAD